MQGMSKWFYNQNTDGCLCWLFQGLNWEILPLKTIDKFVCRPWRHIFEKEFLVKYLSGRTIEFDKIAESERDDQSSATTEIVPEVATMLIAPMTTKSCIHGNQIIY